MGALKDWVKQDWVRIGTDGKIKGPCGTSKDKKNPDRCLPRSKANSLSQAERASTARKKKKAGAKGKTVVPNTKKGKVTKGYTKEDIKNLVVGMIHEMKNNLVTFGYDLDAIQDVVDHLRNNYKDNILYLY